MNSIKRVVFIAVCLWSFKSVAKEYKSLKSYQKETNKSTLQPQDWLKSDRKHNTLVWMNANRHNLLNNNPQEYQTLKQRKDFFDWMDAELNAKGHEVVWPRMAYFISNKLRLLESFPYQTLTSRKIKDYAMDGSNAVFFNSFVMLKELYESEEILKGVKADEWDKEILKKEQYDWIFDVYKTIDDKSLKHIERIAKGKSFYSIFVPKQIRFEGDISNADDRYSYAFHKLREYCKHLTNK